MHGSLAFGRSQLGLAGLLVALLGALGCARKSGGGAADAQPDASAEPGTRGRYQVREGAVLEPPTRPSPPEELVRAARELPRLSTPEPEGSPGRAGYRNTLRQALPYCGSSPRVAVTTLTSYRGRAVPAAPIAVYDLSRPIEPSDTPLVVQPSDLLAHARYVGLTLVGWNDAGQLLLVTQPGMPGSTVEDQVLIIDVSTALTDPQRKTEPQLAGVHDLEKSAGTKTDPGRSQHRRNREYELSRTGRLLVERSSLRVWDAATGGLLDTVHLPSRKAHEPVLSVAFSPDEQRLAVATPTGLYVYDLEQRSVVARHERSVDGHRQVAWEGPRTVVSKMRTQFGFDREKLAIDSGKFESWFERGEALDPSYDALPKSPFESEFGFSVPGDALPCWQSLVDQGLVAPSVEQLLGSAEEQRP